MEEDPGQQSLEDIRARLNQCGLKATPQRLRVYAAMCRMGHASADAVYHFLGGSRGRMSLATVYNVLESMTEAGLLVQRPSFNNKMFFDVNTGDHFHLYNRDSQEMTDITDEALRRSLEARVQEWLPDGMALDRVEVQVICHGPARREP